MSNGHLDIPLAVEHHADAGTLLLRMAFAIHSSGKQVSTTAKLEGNHLTEFLLNTKIQVEGKVIKMQMGVTKYAKKAGAGVPRLYLRASPKHMEDAKRFVNAILEEVVAECLEYTVDVYSGRIWWRVGRREGLVEEVLKVSTTVQDDGEETYHVADFQARGAGTLLRPGVFYL